MTIHKVVEVSINPGMVVKFSEVASKFILRVNSGEPGTLSYEWFFSDNQETCYVLETYRNDEAMLYHLDNIRDLYDELFAVCEITRLQVFGTVSQEVVDAHLPQTEFYRQWAGLTRGTTSEHL